MNADLDTKNLYCNKKAYKKQIQPMLMVMADTKSLPIEQVAELLAAMGNSIRLGILMVLYGSDMIEEDTPCLRFTQIKKITGIASDSVLNHHLGRLVKAGLIEKDPHQDEDGKVFPLYSAAYSAAPLWNSLIESAELRPIIRDILGP